MTETILSVQNLQKRYADVLAVDGVSFDVLRGEIFGLLGPNGAGKTTTLECLEGLRHPEVGALRIAGIDPTRQHRQLRNVIGVQLQSSGMPANIRVDEAMQLFCAYHDRPPRYELLDRLELGKKRGAQYQELSTGQQRRLSLALAIAHAPPVLFLDEPTAGLDVPSRVALHELMRELQASGTTIILATHDMAEAEAMADRIAILLNGRIAATGSPLQITASGAGLTKITVRTENGCLSHPQAVFPAVNQSTFKEDYAVYFSADVGPTVSAVIAFIQAQADKLIDLRIERPSLEDRFLEITQTGGHA
jgi:ABC-2 type transport system ATP-binding protein